MSNCGGLCGTCSGDCSVVVSWLTSGCCWSWSVSEEVDTSVNKVE